MSKSDECSRIKDDAHLARANDKISEMLVKVFGLKLPSELFSQNAPGEIDAETLSVPQSGELAKEAQI